MVGIALVAFDIMPVTHAWFDWWSGGKLPKTTEDGKPHRHYPLPNYAEDVDERWTKVL